MTDPTNAALMAVHVGRTIDRVETTNTGVWHDPDGFIIYFTDGTQQEISADMGQGVGYVIVGD